LAEAIQHYLHQLFVWLTGVDTEVVRPTKDQLVALGEIRTLIVALGLLVDALLLNKTLPRNCEAIVPSSKAVAIQRGTVTDQLLEISG